MSRKPKPAEQRAACRACRHCFSLQHPQKVEKADVQGACRRYPPVMTAVAGGFSTSFPVVRLDMNCGEFKRT